MNFSRLQIILASISLLSLAAGIGAWVLIFPSVGSQSGAVIEPAPVEQEYHYTPIEKQKNTGVIIGQEPVDDYKMNINTATIEHLQALPRVGRKTAEAIHRYRQEHGAFHSVEELTAIRGIGKKTIEKLRSLVYCGPVPTWSDTPSGSSPEGQAQKPESFGTKTVKSQQSPPPKKATGKQGKSESGSKININTATEAELVTLPRIGPATARKIIAYRKQHGPFASVDDLVKVKGIGAKTLERLRSLICTK